MEIDLLNIFYLQSQDSRGYFLSQVAPRLNRSHKLFVAYVGDRQREIETWQANVGTPYIQAVVETLMPRILDARPEFAAQGRSEDDQAKADRQGKLMDYQWEKAKMDHVSEEVVRAALIYGTGFMQTYWKKDVRTYKYLRSNDPTKKKPTWKEETKTYFDGPVAEAVDNYTLWYDWHNTSRESKQFWFKRLVLTAPEIERKYPNADPKRLRLALARPGGDLNDYAAIRYFVRSNHEMITKGAPQIYTAIRGFGGDKYQVQSDQRLRMYEVFEWWRPFDDAFSVIVNYVPILDGGQIPNPFDHKEAPFIEVPYLRMPGEFEGYGLPMILESPQIMLNMIKNQRLDSATLGIHKMWIVNPLANINKEELVARPFGIIYSMDPGGVREVQFSDVKQSAYREEELLKADMRYASGVDDMSMGVGGSAGSATEVRHLRESTLERVRLFVNHLGDAYADVMRHWMSMQRQFFTDNLQIRILGDNGEQQFPLIEKDDLKGEFDYKATVLPSIAGQNDVNKKQNMDLFQLLINMPFVDPRKLTGKVLEPWNFSLDAVTKDDQGQAGVGPDGQPLVGPDGQPVPGAAAPDPNAPPQGIMDMANSAAGAQQQPMNVPQNLPAIMQALGSQMPANMIPAYMANSTMGQAAGPIPLQGGGSPPTVQGVPVSAQNSFVPNQGRGITPQAGGTTNTRGVNRKVGGKVNTNINTSGKSNPESQLLNRSNSIQR